MNRPTGVTRSSLRVACLTSPSSCSRIERNLRIWMISPLQPCRGCRNRTGPGEESFTATAVAASNGLSAAIASTANTRSISPLLKTAAGWELSGASLR